MVILILFLSLQSGMVQAQTCDPCAVGSLSNLTATAIDVSLVPDSDATVDIGGSNSNFDWVDIYLEKVIHFDIGTDFNNEDVLELNGNSFLHVTDGSYDGLFRVNLPEMLRPVLTMEWWVLAIRHWKL